MIVEKGLNKLLVRYIYMIGGWSWTVKLVYMFIIYLASLYLYYNQSIKFVCLCVGVWGLQSPAISDVESQTKYQHLRLGGMSIAIMLKCSV